MRGFHAVVTGPLGSRNECLMVIDYIYSLRIVQTQRGKGGTDSRGVLFCGASKKNKTRRKIGPAQGPPHSRQHHPQPHCHHQCLAPGQPRSSHWSQQQQPRQQEEEEENEEEEEEEEEWRKRRRWRRRGQYMDTYSLAPQGGPAPDSGEATRDWAQRVPSVPLHSMSSLCRLMIGSGIPHLSGKDKSFEHLKLTQNCATELSPSNTAELGMRTSQNLVSRPIQFILVTTCSFLTLQRSVRHKDITRYKLIGLGSGTSRSWLWNNFSVWSIQRRTR